MKKLFKFIGVAALLATVSVNAQPTPAYTPVSVTIPIVQANMTTNLVLSTNALFIYAGKQHDVALEFDCQWCAPLGLAGSVTNALFTLCPTVDGVTYDTNNTIPFSVYQSQIAVNTMNRSGTNLNAHGYLGYYITSIQNTSAAGILSNSVIKYGSKIGAP